MKNNIESTKKYDLFDTSRLNRPLCKKTLKRLVLSIKERDLTHLRPIIVDKIYGIFDGIKRFTACKELDLPVYYVKDETLTDEDRFKLDDVVKNWTISDKAWLFIKAGNDNYKKLLNFRNKHDINFEAALKITTKEYSYKLFKRGEYLFNNSAHANSVMRIISLIYNNGFPEAKLSRCILGLHKLMTKEDFDINALIDNLKKYPMKIRVCSNGNKYYQMFLDLYNTGF